MRKKINHILFVFDRSGSMDSIWNKTTDVLNEQLAALKKEASKHKMETRLTLVSFDNEFDVIIDNKDISEVNPLPYNWSYARDMTALMDAVTFSAGRLKINPRSDYSVVVMTWTDGNENASQCSPSGFSNLMQKLQGTDRWSFVFHTPKQGVKFLKQLGVPEGNIRVWDSSDKSIKEMSQHTNSSMSTYYSNRARGITSTKKFFTNLGSVKKTTIKKELDDVSTDYKLLTTSKEEVIKDFVELKTKKEYHVGAAYYQLMKAEKVQSHKRLLIMDKQTSKIYGGTEARQLVGLPDNMDAKVEPGNHAGYEIFVQSTSVNRKLPRGTKVLVEK